MRLSHLPTWLLLAVAAAAIAIGAVDALELYRDELQAARLESSERTHQQHHRLRRASASRAQRAKEMARKARAEVDSGSDSDSDTDRESAVERQERRALWGNDVFKEEKSLEWLRNLNGGGSTVIISEAAAVAAVSNGHDTAMTYLAANTLLDKAQALAFHNSLAKAAIVAGRAIFVALPAPLVAGVGGVADWNGGHGHPANIAHCHDTVKLSLVASAVANAQAQTLAQAEIRRGTLGIPVGFCAQLGAVPLDTLTRYARFADSAANGLGANTAAVLTLFNDVPIGIRNRNYDWSTSRLWLYGTNPAAGHRVEYVTGLVVHRAAAHAVTPNDAAYTFVRAPWRPEATAAIKSRQEVLERVMDAPFRIYQSDPSKPPIAPFGTVAQANTAMSAKRWGSPRDVPVQLQGPRCDGRLEKLNLIPMHAFSAGVYDVFQRGAGQAVDRCGAGSVKYWVELTYPELYGPAFRPSLLHAEYKLTADCGALNPNNAIDHIDILAAADPLFSVDIKNP